MPPRRNSTSPSAAASRSGRPRSSRARRMIGSCRAASPRGGACSASARRSSMPAPLAAAAEAAGCGAQRDAARGGAGRRASPARRLREPQRGSGAASARSQVARAAAARRTQDRDLGERLDALGEAGGCAARGRLSRAGCRTETVPRPAADAAPICRIDYPRGAPVARARPPPIRPVTPRLPRLPRHRLDRSRPRRGVLRRWLARVGAAPRGRSPRRLRPASSDASFRRYFRADRRDGGSVIVMDAPPPQEDVRPFVHVAGADRGRRPARAARPRGRRGARLPPARRPRQRALPRGAAGRAGERRPAPRRPPDARRDRRARRRGSCKVAGRRRCRRTTTRCCAASSRSFPTGASTRECGVTWSDAEQATWDAACDQLVAAALAQPRRRRAPRLDAAQPDGRRSRTRASSTSRTRSPGPIGYDVASLLRDAFISWDEEQELDWAIRYWEAARKARPAGGRATSASSGAASNGSACSAT